MAKRTKATGSPKPRGKRQTANSNAPATSPSQTHGSEPVNASDSTSTHTHAHTPAHGIGETIEIKLPGAVQVRDILDAKAHRKKVHPKDDTPSQVPPGTPTKRGKRGNYDRLTYKQEQFALAMITAPSAVAAYRRVYNAHNMKDGSAYHQACVLLKNPKVAERVSKLRAELAAKTTLSRAWVLENLMEHATVCLGKKRVKIARASKDGDVHEVEITAHDASAANRALELLGKEAGMFVDRREVGGPGDFARMGDTELLEYIRQQQAELESRTLDLVPIASTGVTTTSPDGDGR